MSAFKSHFVFSKNQRNGIFLLLALIVIVQCAYFYIDFSSDDIILSTLALGSIGDAYLELEDKSKALKYYEKAADNASNDFTTPRYLMKQAIVLEMGGEYEDALEIYNQIKEDYSKSQIAQDIDKYIVRASNR